MELTPLTRRRLANFRANRRGFWSLRIFIVLLVLSLFAELIANDKPLLLGYDDQIFVPILFRYPETTFGGVLHSEATYRDPEVKALIEAGHGWMLWPPVPYSYNTIDWQISEPVPSPPSARHWLGTDNVARDVLARIIYGFRLSVLFGLVLTLLSSIVGIGVGAVQGFFGGWVDLIGQRLVEIWAGMPVLFLLIILASLVQASVFMLLGLLLLFSWMQLVAVVRAEFLRTRNFDYVQASRSLGVSNFEIMRQDVLPNAMVAALTFLPFILTGSITTLTSLDFLGFGLPAGSPSLGELLAQGKSNLQAPWLGLSGFFTLLVMLTLLIFIGEAVRDAFDPRRSVVSVDAP
ncbi:ABC transporter permease [Pseudomonadales bacterium]|nr:ABC transporter permease [Pseudomonadales bacterium]MDC1328748.1 ABC transporter permease [Pseudomonadales bacterium]MDC3343981.1 ABC transporter permease [Pseudomonadales bacterium]